MGNVELTNELTELDEEIKELSIRQTKLDTQLEAVNESLASYGIKDIDKVADEIQKMQKELDGIATKARALITEIKESLNEEEADG